MCSSNSTSKGFLEQEESTPYQAYVYLRELNPYITCAMCAGYLIDATTIKECHHRFCKSCIVQHLQSSSFCPECDVALNATDPLSCLAFDRNVQDLVHKLVPGLQLCEKRLRKEFYASHSLEMSKYTRLEKKPLTLSDSGEVQFHSQEQKISVEILPHPSLQDDSLKRMLHKRIHCSGRTLVSRLKRFINKKVQIPPPYKLELLCNETVLDEAMSVNNVYLELWAVEKKEIPILIYYAIRNGLS